MLCVVVHFTSLKTSSIFYLSIVYSTVTGHQFFAFALVSCQCFCDVTYSSTTFNLNKYVPIKCIALYKKVKCHNNLLWYRAKVWFWDCRASGNPVVMVVYSKWKLMSSVDSCSHVSLARVRGVLVWPRDKIKSHKLSVGSSQNSQ